MSNDLHQPPTCLLKIISTHDYVTDISASASCNLQALVRVSVGQCSLESPGAGPLLEIMSRRYGVRSRPPGELSRRCGVRSPGE